MLLFFLGDNMRLIQRNNKICVRNGFVVVFNENEQSENQAITGNYIKTDGSAMSPSGIGYGTALSDDGQLLALAHGGTNFGAFFNSYKWNSDSNRYEMTNIPDIAPPATARGVAMSSDGTYLAIAHLGTSSPIGLVTYRWSNANQRYEKTNNPNIAPGWSAYGAAISADGQYLGIAHAGTSGDSRFISYTWNEGNNRYEKTNTPNIAPTGTGNGIAMSADGQYVAVAHSGTTGDSYLTTYRWSGTNQRYEKNNTPDVLPSGVSLGAAVSNDGRYLAVAHNGTGFLITYRWHEVNQRYEQTNAPDIAPTGAGRGVAMSNDGRYIAVAHSGTTAPARLTTYAWHEVNNRYEKTANPDVAPSAMANGAAMSGTGLYLAIGYAGTAVDPFLLTYRSTFA